jgi:hypothetical protein
MSTDYCAVCSEPMLKHYTTEDGERLCQCCYAQYAADQEAQLEREFLEDTTPYQRARSRGKEDWC